MHLKIMVGINFLPCRNWAADPYGNYYLTSSPPYDYIIAGAGCAGLSLAMNMIRSGRFSDKKILLVDQDPKRSNDRTWCFWETSPGIFEDIVYHQWSHLWFHGPGYSDELDVKPYRYKMIRGIDFYEYCFRVISEQPNFSFLQEKVEHVFSSELTTGVMVNGAAIHSHYVFNSILFEKPELNKKQFWMLQHFRGWMVETESPVFDPQRATLMDFRISQTNGTSFCYVLPFTSQRALVEYTVFSKNLLEMPHYERELEMYIRDVLGIQSYSVSDHEFGVIPMTNFPFSPGQNRVIHIGTAGGQTKGSSGYTFSFIQKHSRDLVNRLVANKNLLITGYPKRFGFYDSVLLNILYNNTLEGSEIFTRLFRKK